MSSTGPNVRIRKFTPSLLDGDDLERLYVERDDVLGRVVQRVDDARAGQSVGHVLVVGPRGSGKTHLVSLVHHHARREHPTAPISWLVEDPYVLFSYDDVLASIVERCSPIIENPGSTTAEREQALIDTARAHGPVLVLAENFDEILEQIGEVGQQRLRRLAETSFTMQLVVTTTSISTDLSSQPAPFYGFFNQYSLRRFTTAESVEYLTRRATVMADTEFVDALTDSDTADMARRRVMSIEQLAGGQPRVWALLAEGLTIERLDELVLFLIDNFDDITPYYQSQLRTLAPLQRRIVFEMVRANRPLSAKMLAAVLDVAATSVTKTLRDLDERGWVDVVDSPLLELMDRRITLYELAEPLLRLALELKDTDRSEIRLIVDFVKLWFDAADMGGSNSAYAARARGELGPHDTATASRWMLNLPTVHTPSLIMLSSIFDAIVDLGDGNGEAIFALPAEIRRAVEARLADESRGALLADLCRQAVRNAGYSPTPETRQWLRRAELLATNDDVRRPEALVLLAKLQATNHDFESANATSQMVPNDHRPRITWSVAHALGEAGRFDHALVMLTDLLTYFSCIVGPDNRNLLTIRHNIAYYTSKAGDAASAINQLAHLLTDCTRDLGPDDPVTLATRHTIACSTGEFGEPASAIEQLRQLVADQTRIQGPNHVNILTTRHNIARYTGKAGDAASAINQLTDLAAERNRIHGPNHPATLATRSRLAQFIGEAGEPDRAAAQLTEVMTAQEHALGPNHPDLQETRDLLERFASQ